MSSLETVSKNLGKSVREIHKTTTKQSTASAPALAPTSTPALSVNTPVVNGNQPLSYATAAANSPNANWKVIEKKKTQALKLKHTLSNH